MDKPAPPPEAVLLRRARLAAGMKMPEVARAAGISKARLSQIENGFERRLGSYRPVRGGDGTIAHLAAAVGISPSRLREAGRADAAAVLEEIERRARPERAPAEQKDRIVALVEVTWGSMEDAPEHVRIFATAEQFPEDFRLSMIEGYIDRTRPGTANPGRHLREA